MLYKEELYRMISELKSKREWLEKELDSLPEGFLHIQRKDSSEFYSIRIPKGGNRKKERRKGISNLDDTVNQLVRKRYIVKALAVIDKNLHILEMAAKRYIEFDEESVMRDFIHNHPELQHAVFRNAQIDEDWARNYRQAEGLYDEHRTSLTSDKMRTRSRGEVIIAEKLKQYDIPFRYEGEIGHPDIPYVPDFTVRRPKDGKVFYWEHFGDVNNEEYMSNNQRKLITYSNYGIVPWDNLIITYDTADGGVNTPLIESMIHAWLL